LIDDTSNSIASPFAAARYADNPDPRCACVLVLDKSGSMAGNPIRELNAGLQQLRQELLEDPLACRRVEMAVVPFGPVVRGAAFYQADTFDPQPLHAEGGTPTGEALNYAMDLVERQKQAYKSIGIPYYRPWIILITDGQPTDAWHAAAQRLQAGEARKAWTCFALGIQGADMNVLRQISPRAVPLRGLAFKEFFIWLSASLSGISRSSIGSQVVLAPTNSWTIES
jgi:uncharacterized protein YegL